MIDWSLEFPSEFLQQTTIFVFRTSNLQKLPATKHLVGSALRVKNSQAKGQMTSSSLNDDVTFLMTSPGKNYAVTRQITRHLLIDWLIDWLIGWLIDCLGELLSGCGMQRAQFDHVIGFCCVDWLDDWLIGWLIGQPQAGAQMQCEVWIFADEPSDWLIGGWSIDFGW